MLNPNLKFIDIDDWHKESMKDPKFRKEWDALEPEFRLIRTIIQKRAISKMTQKELAEKMGTDQATLSRYENGNYNPSIKFLKRMAKALDAELEIKLV